jgi:hypothetical protein
MQSLHGIHSEFLRVLLNNLQDKYYGGQNFPSVNEINAETQLLQISSRRSFIRQGISYAYTYVLTCDYVAKWRTMFMND